MNKILQLAAFILCTFAAYAGTISGRITDTQNQPLAFASIIIKGTTQGTSANSAGYYSIDLDKGTYTLLIQHVGYKSVEKKVVVGKDAQEINFELPVQQYDLGSVVVKQGEDPAYEIIRQAIAKKDTYEKEIKKFETDVYLKGQLKLRDFPNRFMGEKVDFEDGDTSKKKMIFLSETIGKYYVSEPKRKIEVISTKVSGRSDAFGFSNPQIFSFYENNIRLGNLNPRGFVSPIADNALSFYRYKFEGTFFDNGKMVNRIKVIPRRTYEPLFNGYINIIEGEWRIHSVQLTLYKENQMQFVDTLVVEQIYVPLGKAWVIKQQTIIPSIKMFGFDAHGSFVQVYDKFNLDPKFPKGFFDNTVLKFYDSANKKSLAYWDTARPIPLLAEEAKDYVKKDSIEQLHKDPKYLDSLDRKRNKPSAMGLIFTGYTYQKSKKLSYLSMPSLIHTVSYNTVEGVVVDFNPTYVKRFSETGRQRISVTPTIRYGFSNKRFNPAFAFNYTYGKKYLSSFSLSGGRDVIQYNTNEPVGVFGNTINTLLFKNNFLKLYEAGFAKISFTRDLGEGFAITGEFKYEDRIPLANTSEHTLIKVKNREFTPNIMELANKASVASVNIRWRPGNRYIEFPDRKVSIGSKWPTFNITVSKGIPNLFNSYAEFLKWRFTVTDNLNLKLQGRLSYRLAAGGFLNNNSVYLQDYVHYFGNQSAAANPYVRSFQNMPFYTYSNQEKLYGAANIEYHLNGFLTNKIPGFKKLNWFLVTGTNYLYVNKNLNYGEAFIGLENIFKVGRLDFVYTYSGVGYHGPCFKYSIRGITNN